MRKNFFIWEHYVTITVCALKVYYDFVVRYNVYMRRVTYRGRYMVYTYTFP